MRIKICTLLVGKKFFATSYFKTLRTLHCYYCRYFNVTWTYIAVDCYLNVVGLCIHE